MREIKFILVMLFSTCSVLFFMMGCQSSFKEGIRRENSMMVRKIKYDKQVTDEWDDILLEAPKVAKSYDPLYDFTVNTDTVVYIADKKRHSYNFLITRNKPILGFENLVLNYEEGTYEAYLTTYDQIPGQSGKKYESTKIRTLYDFDFSKIGIKKPAPCHKLVNSPLKDGNEQGSVIYSELIEVLDEKCLKQRKKQNESDIKRRTYILTSPVFKTKN